MRIEIAVIAVNYVFYCLLQSSMYTKFKSVILVNINNFKDAHRVRLIASVIENN